MCIRDRLNGRLCRRSTPARWSRPAGRSTRGAPDLKCLVSTVAERLIAGTLAAAKPELFGLGHGEFHRRKLRPLVRTVTERLALGTPAAAPPVVAGRKLYRVGGLLRDVGFGHFRLLFEGRRHLPPYETGLPRAEYSALRGDPAIFSGRK